MKSLFFTIFIIILCSIGSAKELLPTKDSVLFVIFETRGKIHFYTLISEKGKNILKFTDERKKVFTKQISLSQRNILTNEATRIIWNSQYRKPSSLSDVCHEYATIQTLVEKAKICYENKMATGQAFGFLNELHSVIE